MCHSRRHGSDRPESSQSDYNVDILMTISSVNANLIGATIQKALDAVLFRVRSSSCREAGQITPATMLTDALSEVVTTPNVVTIQDRRI